MVRRDWLEEETHQKVLSRCAEEAASEPSVMLDGMIQMPLLLAGAWSFIMVLKN